MLERNHTFGHPRSSHFLRLNLPNTRCRSWWRRLVGNTRRRSKISLNLEDSDLTGGVMLYFYPLTRLLELFLLLNYLCYLCYLCYLNYTITFWLFFCLLFFSKTSLSITTLFSLLFSYVYHFLFKGNTFDVVQ